MSGTSDEIARLRRVAYGPGATAEERTAAEAELRALSVADHAHLEPVVVDASEPPASVLAPQEAEATDELPERVLGIRPFWLIPIVVAAIGVGAVGALGATGHLGIGTVPAVPSRSPTSQPPVESPTTGPPVGDLEAADNWFQSEPGPSDVFPNPAQLAASHVDPATVRFMAEKEEGTDVVTVWVAKNQSGGFCLLAVLGTDAMTASSCTTRYDFANYGLAFAENHILVSWDGAEVSISRMTG